ncbi:hypothetical protein AA313_de0206188 [Arthrobotrys entomopaga]|nr:hypothetical protein AA313_de0206188 [Arthrobotrys entomopaga]
MVTLIDDKPDYLDDEKPKWKPTMPKAMTPKETKKNIKMLIMIMKDLGHELDPQVDDDNDELDTDQNETTEKHKENKVPAESEESEMTKKFREMEVAGQSGDNKTAKGDDMKNRQEYEAQLIERLLEDKDRRESLLVAIEERNRKESLQAGSRGSSKRDDRPGYRENRARSHREHRSEKLERSERGGDRGKTRDDASGPRTDDSQLAADREKHRTSRHSYRSHKEGERSTAPKSEECRRRTHRDRAPDAKYVGSVEDPSQPSTEPRKHRTRRERSPRAEGESASRPTREHRTRRDEQSIPDQPASEVGESSTSRQKRHQSQRKREHRSGTEREHRGDGSKKLDEGQNDSAQSSRRTSHETI